jgi:hypothetical protein
MDGSYEFWKLSFKGFVWQRRNRREIERREKKHENQCMNLD